MEPRCKAHGGLPSKKSSTATERKWKKKERIVSELNDKSNMTWVFNIKYHFIQYITLRKLPTNMHSNFTENTWRTSSLSMAYNIYILYDKFPACNQALVYAS